MDLFRRLVKPTALQLKKALKELESSVRLLAERSLNEGSKQHYGD